MLDKIKIGGVEYTIKEVPYITDTTNLIGRVEHLTATIEVLNYLNPQIKLQVILHEILHTILHQADTHPEDEEHIVDVIASGLVGIIQNNNLKGEWLIWNSHLNLITKVIW